MMTQDSPCLPSLHQQHMHLASNAILACLVHHYSKPKIQKVNFLHSHMKGEVLCKQCEIVVLVISCTVPKTSNGTKSSKHKT